MKENPIYNATGIGMIFSGCSFLLTFTFVVPMFTILPGAYLEQIVASFIDNEPYSNVGKVTILLLVILLMISLGYIYYRVRHTALHKGHITGFMFLNYFIFHTLGVYILWATKLNFRSDGQLGFAIFESFPISSFGFLFLGIFIDLIKIKPSADQN